MGVTGDIHFFTEHRPENAVEWVEKTIDLFDVPEKVEYGIFVKRYDPDRLDYVYISSEDRPTIEKTFLEELNFDRNILYIEPYPSGLLSRLCRAVERISEEIRNGFSINSVILEIGGGFDISDSDDNFLGRAFYDLYLFGYSCPDHTNNFREALFQLPEILDLKTKIESFVGPINTCSYWG